MIISCNLLTISESREREQNVLFGGLHSPRLLRLWLHEMGLRLTISLNKAFQLLSVLFKELTVSDA